MKKNKQKPILITGAAGFIGAALASELIARGEKVVGIDNLNNYYDTNLKLSRLKEIEESDYSGLWKFKKISIDNNKNLKEIFQKENPKIVLHLAAQAGVRYSLTNPADYVKSNLVGFANILEQCREYKVEHLVFASSSSVYGGNQIYPFKESQPVDHPVSFYAATKRSNELMAHSYSHLFGIPITGLRFFTVYGPLGRPDMAPMIFAKAIFNNQPIEVFNNGEMFRNFTYIDDVVEATLRCCFKPASKTYSFDPKKPNPSISFAPFKILNVGNQTNIKLLKFIQILENSINKKAHVVFKDLQPGDVKNTFADSTKLSEWTDYLPKISLSEGIDKFVKWYKSYYNF